MTAPDRRRPLPALVAIAALTLLTALVWFRVLHRSNAQATATNSTCPTPTVSAPAPSALPKPGLVTLVVLNSTERNGLAGGVRTVLLKDGFQIPSQAAGDGTQYGGHGLITGVGEIRFGPSERVAAALVSYYLPGATLVQTDASGATVIVSLGQAFVSVASPAAVTAAIAAAHQHVTSPAPSPTPVPSSSATC